LWDGRPARLSGTGGTPIPQICVNYLIRAPKAMDIFMSLVATTRKLGISFFEYMNDRISHLGNIPSLGTILREQSFLCSFGMSWEYLRNSKKYKGSELLALDSFSKCRINPRLIVTCFGKNYDILDFMIDNTLYSTMLCLDCEPYFFAITPIY
jgi:hypothetical protein